MDVFDLAAKISLDTSPFEKGLSRAKDKMSMFGDVFKANIASDVVSKGFNAMTTGIGKAVDGFKSLVTESTNAYGDYEQMIGGVQKLYGNMGKSPKEYARLVGKSTDEVRGQWNMLEDAQNTVIKNAENAYKTSGMSMNSYMDTATQFSASLIKSLGGDTKKAADQTDVAMRAISDNFNTFGGNIEDITNAYKGFSKQNYTMLDNLKLGYGGTKTEMENLIKDANTYAKSIGQAGNLSINSFSDIVTAIDLIQKKQQIAGTTAREASTTLEGSFGQMQAAWENLKTNISNKDADIGKNVSQLVDTIVGRSATAEDVAVGAAKHIGDHIGGYLDNLMPIVEKALDGIGQLVTGLAPIITEELPKLMKKIVPPVVEAIGTLATTIIQALPEVVQSIEEAFSSAFGNVDLSKITSKVSDLIAGLFDAIAGLLPDLITIGAELITALIQGIADNSQKLLDGAKDIITALGNGIIQNAPQLMSSATTIITSLLSYITQNSDAIISGALQIIETLGQGLITNLPKLADAVVQLLQSLTTAIDEHKDELSTTAVAIVTALVSALIEIAPSLAEAGGTLVGAIGQALIDNIPVLVEKLPEFVSSINSGLSQAFGDASPEGKLAIAGVVGKMVVGGIGDGICKVKETKDTIGKVKDVFGTIFGDDGLVSKIKGVDFKGTADAFSMLGSSLKMSAGLKLESLGNFFKTLGSTIGSGVMTGIGNLGGFLTGTLIPGIGGLITTLTPFLPLILGISAAVVGIILVIKNWDKVSKALSVTWEFLKSVATKVFYAIQAVISGVWNKIKDVTSKVWDGIKSKLSGIWDGIKGTASKVFNGVKDTVKGAWDKLKTNTTEAWDNIKSTVKKNGGGIKGVIKTAADGYLAPWKKGFEALDKASNGKLSEAVGHVKVKLKEMQAKFKANNAKMKFIAKGMIDKIKEGWSGIKKAGGDFVKGLWNGIKDKVGWIVDKVKGFGKKVLKALKDFFKIKSPSRVMRDEVGVNLALGVAKGIEKGTPKATKASDKLADSIYKSLKKTTKKSIKIASDAASKASKEAEKGSKTKRTTKEVRLSQSEIDTNYISATEKKIRELQKAGKMTDKQQSALWISVSKRVKKGSTAYNTALNNVKKATANTRKSLLDNFQKTSDDFQAKNKKGREMTLSEQVAYWKTAKKYFKKNTDEWIEVQKTYLEKKKALQEAEKQADADLKTSLTNAEKTYKDAIQASLDKIKQRKQEILSAFSLFEKFDSGEAVSKSTLVDNLDSQVTALQDWKKQIAELKKRTGDTTMFREIQSMGVKGLNQVIALNTMTDEELKKYADTYHNRNLMAGNEAETELAKEVAKDNQTALNDYMKSVNSAWNTYVKTMGDAGVKVTDLTKSVTKSVGDVGEIYTKALDKMGFATDEKASNISSTLSKSLKKLSKSTKKYGSDLMDNFINGIESKEKDLSDTVIKSIAKQVKKYVGFSEPEAGPLSNFHTFAPDMIDLFVKGIEDNAGRISTAFDNSLPLEDISDRVSQSMIIPRQNNVNSLQIAGLPNLTPVNSQQNTNNQPLVLNAVFKVGKTEFAKLIYELNKEETQRVGVSLATGSSY